MSTQPTTDLVIDTLVPGSVKAAMKEAGASSSDLWMVPYKDIRVIEGFNVRVRNAEYEAHLHNIRDSIIANGFYRDKPLEGYVAKEDGSNVIYITGGHTRYEAAGLAIDMGAAIEALPIIVKPAGTSQEDLTVALVTGNSGRPLTPIETAIVIKRLLGFGLDEKKVAARLGYGKKYVEDLLSLLSAPAAVRKLVEQGKVSATLAIAEIKKDPKEAAKKLTEAMKGIAETGKTKITKKTLDAVSNQRVRPSKIVGDIHAPYQETEDHVFYLLKVRLEDADAIDRKRIEIKILGDAPQDEPAAAKPAADDDL